MTLASLPSVGEAQVTHARKGTHCSSDDGYDKPSVQNTGRALGGSGVVGGGRIGRYTTASRETCSGQTEGAKNIRSRGVTEPKRPGPHANGREGSEEPFELGTPRRTGVRASVVATKPGNSGGAKGCRKVENAMTKPPQDQPAAVPQAKQAGESNDYLRWWWTEDSVWTERMLAALEKGVKGGMWNSLIDKVYAKSNLQSAFGKVLANGGASGVDHQSSVTTFIWTHWTI